MSLTVILGPMKSGKSFEMISHFAPLGYSDVQYALFQPIKNVRDEGLNSRAGMALDALKIERLSEIDPQKYDIVGIDEIHMFDHEEVGMIDILLRNQTKVIISGLDMDYRGKLFQIVLKLLELGPNHVIHKRAVCEVCREFGATNTQLFFQDHAVVEGVPSVIPEDGTYIYKAVCRNCFVRG